MKKTIFENEISKLEFEEGVIIGTFIPKLVDLEHAQKITKIRLEYQNGRAFPILSNIIAVKSSTREARDFLASEKGCEGVIAAAILVESAFNSLLANFFLSVNKPRVPTRLFTNEEEAKKWLSQFKK